MATLKELNEQIADALEEMFANVNEETGEVDTSKLDELNVALKEKKENIVKFLINKKAIINARNTEMERLGKLNKRDERQMDWLLNTYLNEQMGETETFTCPDGTIAHRESKAVRVLDESKIPATYKVLKVENKVNKAAILKDLKEGKEIAGTELEIRRKVVLR